LCSVRLHTVEAVIGRLRDQGFRLPPTTTVLAVQHVQDSLIPLIDGLCRLGIQPDAVRIAAKSYSSQPDALADLRSRGIHVEDDGRMLDPTVGYERELAERVQRLVDEALLRGGPILALDEGGSITAALHRRRAGEHGVAVVEQTTRGARTADRLALSFPVVDVARSETKSDVEGPLIAESMLRGLHRAEQQLGRPSGRVAVVGLGTIGRRVADLLASTGRDVLVHDRDSSARQTAGAEGHRVVALAAAYAEADVIVGCTGYPIIAAGELDRLRRPCLLVNGASSDLEFPLWSHRRPDAVVAHDGPVDPGRPWLYHYRVEAEQSHVLAAGGFPVNFFRTDEPIPARQFQVTRALMLAGAAQAVAETRPGVRPLHPELQAFVRSAHEAEVGAAVAG
jgi:S-adenosylhomocysteine hydrolase